MLSSKTWLVSINICEVEDVIDILLPDKLSLICCMLKKNDVLLILSLFYQVH